jgi:hypothetical protein
MEVVKRMVNWLVLVKGERRVEDEDRDGQRKEGHSSDTIRNAPLAGVQDWHACCGIVEELAQGDDGKVQSREVVVQEQLALHQVEGEVVQRPAEHRSTKLVIEALESSVRVIVAVALPAENGNSLEANPNCDGESGCPPNDRVAKEVHLGVVTTPEVDTAAEDWPRFGTRVPGV